MKLVFPGGEHSQVLLEPGVNRVGSDPHGTVVLSGPGVQPRHCQIHVTAQGVMLDVPPEVTLRVNGSPVAGLITLRPGDTVDLGGIEARLAGIATVAPAGADAAAGPLAPANDELGATTVRPVVPDFVLCAVSGSAFGRHVPVRGTVTFGRAPECTVSVDEPGLSRLHARLLAGDGGLVLEDMGSSNGSFINGRRVLRGPVRAGDEISMDNLRFRVVSNVRVEAPLEERVATGGRRWWWAAVAAVAVVTAGWAGMAALVT